MFAPSDLLRYWRASLADGQLPSFPDKPAMRPVSWDEIREGRVPAEVAKTLLSDHRSSGRDQGTGSRAGGQDEPTSVPVLIAPLVFIACHHHGTAGKNSDKPYTPLIIPAQMALDGALFFDPAKHQPWVWRGALDPSAVSGPLLGSLDDFDAFRSSTPRPQESDWPCLIHYADDLCQALTGANLAEARLIGYERAPAMIVAAIPPASPAKNIVSLADALLEKDQSLPATLISAAQSGPMRPQITGSSRWDASVYHYGQMGADYPLAERQRDAVHHFCACKDGEILPVNGPPGTGKTTLLQSIVATMVVDAALAGGDPPVIAITSTNNQAVTNVIDSFGKVEPPSHRRNDPLEGRWLPGVKSYALYLPAASKEVDEDKYHVVRLPEYSRPLSGMPAKMLQGDAVTQATAAFLASAKAAFATEFTDASAVATELRARLTSGVGRLKNYLILAKEILELRALFPDQTAESFARWVQEEIQKGEDRIAAQAQHVENARQQAEMLRNSRRHAEDAAEHGLEELQPSGGFIGWVTGLLPSVRAKRWQRCRRIIRQAGIEDGPFASLIAPKDVQQVRLYLDEYLADLRQRTNAAEQNAIKLEHEAKDSSLAIRGPLEDLRSKADAWLAREQQWAMTVDDVCLETAKIGSVKKITPREVIARPQHIEALLDVTLRHDLFLLATHYWEARWLEVASMLLQTERDPLKALSRKSREKTEERWRFMACLTPCFVSTLFMWPKHLQFYDPDAANKNPPLTDFVDLLIVDEAGQVPAEIGGIGLSLGRKALVVGDIYQIEPVWSIGPQIDEGNISRYGLRGQADALEDAGCRASSGSLMKLARHASAFSGDTKDDPGIFLAEHRRCQTPIVAICNDLVYANRLVPCTPALANPAFPPLGWANVRSPSGRRGGSRFNAGEAEAIAEWLGRHRQEIEGYYGKDIHHLVGIVTPFSAQKGEIRSALRRHGIDGDLTVGTVHALQGAEREIVLFSPVHTAEDGGQPFFDCGPNMVNVAVSRARHSFFLFGDMRIFDPDRAGAKVPSAIMGSHLLGQADYEILDALTRPDFMLGEAANHTTRLDSLAAHQQALREAFQRAARKVLVVSPYLSIEAVVRDGIEPLIREARQRNVAVMVAFDPQLNHKAGALKPACVECLDVLENAGAKLIECARIHNKTLAVDETWIIEGSFNWLSAVRDPNLPFARAERSLRYQGPNASKFIKDAWHEVMPSKGG